MLGNSHFIPPNPYKQFSTFVCEKGGGVFVSFESRFVIVAELTLQNLIAYHQFE